MRILLFLGLYLGLLIESAGQENDAYRYRKMSFSEFIDQAVSAFPMEIGSMHSKKELRKFDWNKLTYESCESDESAKYEIWVSDGNTIEQVALFHQGKKQFFNLLHFSDYTIFIPESFQDIGGVMVTNKYYDQIQFFVGFSDDLWHNYHHGFELKPYSTYVDRVMLFDDELNVLQRFNVTKGIVVSSYEKGEGVISFRSYDSISCPMYCNLETLIMGWLPIFFTPDQFSDRQSGYSYSLPMCLESEKVF